MDLLESQPHLLREDTTGRITHGENPPLLTGICELYPAFEDIGIEFELHVQWNRELLGVLEVGLSEPVASGETGENHHGYGNESDHWKKSRREKKTGARVQ